MILRYKFDSIDSVNSENLAKYSIFQYGNNNHLYLDVETILLKLCGKISIELRPCSGSLTYNQIHDLIMKNRIKKSIGYNKKDPSIGDYIKTKIIRDIILLEDKHLRFRDKLTLIRNCIENNQYTQAKNEVLDIAEEEEWIQPIYCWLLNRLNDSKEMDIFIQNYTGKDYQVLFEIAFHYFFMEDYERALKTLGLISSDIQSSEVNLLYSLIYSRTNKINESIKYAKKCIDIDESNIDGIIMLASLMQETDADKAVELLMKAKKMNPDYPSIYLVLSSISEINDDFRASAIYLKDYIRLSGDKNLIILLKVSIFLNYVDDDNWEEEFINAVRKNQDILTEPVRIPFVILPKMSTPTAFYEFIVSEGKSILTKNGTIISKPINSAYIFGIGAYATPSNNFLTKFNENYFSNPARLADDSLETSALSPTVFCFTRSYEDYKKIVDGLIDTDAFVLNHIYADNHLEYVDKNNSIRLELKKIGNEIEGFFTVEDKLKHTFTIYSVGNGYADFNKYFTTSPYQEAFFVCSTIDQVHMCIFTFKTSQIHKR